MPGYTPPLNETTSPYQFDGTIVVGGSNATAALTPMTPMTVGLKAWTFPTYLAAGTSSGLALIGSVYLAAVHLNASQTYSNIYINVRANIGTAQAGSCWAGIYNSGGSLVATTNDISGVLGTAAGNTGYLAFPLSTAYTPPAAGVYWTALQINSGTAVGSAPSFATPAGALSTLTTGANTVAGPVLTSGFPFAAVATTGATALPGTFALGSAIGTGAYVYWAGLA